MSDTPTMRYIDDEKKYIITENEEIYYRDKLGMLVPMKLHEHHGGKYVRLRIAGSKRKHYSVASLMNKIFPELKESDTT